MRVATICKHFTFHAAHQLPNHDGPCRDLHGHTYKLEVSVTGHVKQPKAEEPDPDEGMVIDFTRVKEAYEERIEPLVEHKFLNDTLKDRLPMVITTNGRVPLTTTENVASWMQREFTDALLPAGDAFSDSYIRVTLWETPSSYARIPADRNGLERM